MTEEKKRLAVLTGAGVSKQSGVPTFVEMGDLREKLSRSYYTHQTKDFFDIIQGMKKICDEAVPNAAHIAIAAYDVPVVTMNIDGLHTRAGSRNVCEIHGNLRDIYCSGCRKKYGYEVLEKGIRCPKCGALLDPDIVLYGDMIPRLSEALQIARDCDTLLIVGTSFYTSTASYVSDEAKYAGAKVVLINDDAKTQVPEYLNKYYGDQHV
jgi:NAD-dependent deacetylase